MSKDSTSIGDRFKDYEAISRTTLPRRVPAIIRLDGRAFHNYTRGMERPYSIELAAAIDTTAQRLCEQVAGTVLAYTQSDEISLVVVADGKLTTQAWFGGEVQKVVSIAASIATGAFNAALPRASIAQFDARVFTVPDLGEASNYLIWRQRDAVRNSISMAAQAKFSHRQLHGKSTGDMQDMLHSVGVNWNDYPARFKRGGQVVKVTEWQDVTYTRKDTGETITDKALRSRWDVSAAEHFTYESLTNGILGLGMTSE